MTPTLLLTALLVLQGAAGLALVDDYLEKCCGLGGSWAGQRMRCERFAGPVPESDPWGRSACLEAADICCRRAYQEEACAQGRADARANAPCATSGQTSADSTDFRRHCCEGCKLGISTGSSGKGCAFKKFTLGVAREPAFKECCTEAMISTTQNSSSTTATISTSPAITETTEAMSESEEIDNGIYETTDPSSSTNFKSDNLCHLMRGILCSEICVPTPGFYYCKCREGSILQEDGRSCKSNNITTMEKITSISNSSKMSTSSTLEIINSSVNPTLSSSISASMSSLNSTTSSEPLNLSNSSTISMFPNLTNIQESINLPSNSSDIAVVSAISENKKKSMWSILPASTFKIFAMDAKSRTTRSSPTEDNELNLPCPAGYRFTPSTETCDDIDECADGTHNCGTQKCYNSPGSFQCAKATLPVLRRKPLTTPKSSIGSIREDNCSVGTSYDEVRGGCIDVNECEEMEDACNSNEECKNTPGSFRCTCITGFRRDELTQACVDVNECQLENDCLASQRCDNTIGSYTCVRFLPCGTGYTLNAATEICEDDDECSLGTHDCGPGYNCRNTLGSYRCDKNRGRTTTTQKPTTRRTIRPTFKTTFAPFIISRTTSISTSPSTTTTMFQPTTTTTSQPLTTSTPRTTTTTTPKSIGIIIPRTTTTTTPRSISVITLRSTTTIAPRTTTTYRSTTINKPRIIITTTTEDIPTVGTLSTTTQTLKSTTSIRTKINCPRGFESGPLGQCIDIDECHRNFKMCGGQRCINTIGSYRCEPRKVCGIGYAADPITAQCKDINECVQGLHKCGPEQTCENRQGGYICYCPLGYEVGGNHKCVDVDECERAIPGHLCGDVGYCVNSPGSYHCECGPGFEVEPAGGGCRDTNECTAKPGPCQQECYNTWGGHRCGCRLGYRLRSDNRTCEDVDECSEFKGTSLCVGICDNTPGSYVCRCPDGYKLADDGRTCQDIDECSTGNVCKKPGELCQNVRGGFRCNKINCPPDYINDLQRKNRCVPEKLFCSVDDQACFQRPAHYTYNYISIVSMFPIPVAKGQVELFTMRGAYNLVGSSVTFSVAFIAARAPPHVQPATESCFALRKPFPAQAVLVMTQSIQGPQDIELEFSMEIYGPSGTFAGSAVAKIFIIVSQYEF